MTWRRAIPVVVAIDQPNMKAWEEEAARDAIVATVRKRIPVLGVLTETCVSIVALAAAEDGNQIFVVGEGCGGLTPPSPELALRLMGAAGRRTTSGMRIPSEPQCDWCRHVTYDDGCGAAEEIEEVVESASLKSAAHKCGYLPLAIWGNL